MTSKYIIDYTSGVCIIKNSHKFIVVEGFFIYTENIVSRYILSLALLFFWWNVMHSLRAIFSVCKPDFPPPNFTMICSVKSTWRELFIINIRVFTSHPPQLEGNSLFRDIQTLPEASCPQGLPSLPTEWRNQQLKCLLSLQLLQSFI